MRWPSGLRDPGPVRSRPVLLVLTGIASVQVGAAFAKSVFDEASPSAIVWLRLLTSSLILLAAVRPRLQRSRGDWALAGAFGVSLGLMNWLFYQSIARIPLGIAVTLEFLGPLLLALGMSKRRRDLAWVALAGLGVVLLGSARGHLTLVGAAAALGAGAAWASYIMLSARTGRTWPGLDGLAIASCVACLVVTPTVALDPRGLGHAHVWWTGIAVGLLSSVIPYSCELVALRSLSPSVFGVLMSLEPAAAALAGLVVVHEKLSATQWLALIFVVSASAGMTRISSTSDGAEESQAT